MKKMKKQKIYITVYRNANGDIYRVIGREHSQSIICAAVSILLLNACNSIQALTRDPIQVEYDEAGGFLDFTLPQVQGGVRNHDTALLLTSMMLGLRGVAAEYAGRVYIYETVEDNLSFFQ